jgi:hypothetical protein
VERCATSWRNFASFAPELELELELELEVVARTEGAAASSVAATAVAVTVPSITISSLLLSQQQNRTKLNCILLEERKVT